METVISLFKQIQSTSSLNEKKVIINDNKDNELFKKCLKFLCDSNIQTGLSTKKISKKVHPSNYILAEFEDVIQYLKTNNTGTDYDISMIQSFINEQPKEYRSFYIDLITKKFRLGCDKKVVNNVIPGLIPSWTYSKLILSLKRTSLKMVSGLLYLKNLTDLMPDGNTDN